MRPGAVLLAAFVLAMAVPGIVSAQGDDAVAAQGAPSPTAAADLPVLSSPVVTLDRQRLFEESAFGRAVQSRYTAASNDLLAENRKLEASLEQEERSLTDRRKTAEPEAFRTLAAEFDTRVEELRRAQEAKSRALTRARDADQTAFFEAALPVLGQLMVDLSAVAIIDRSAIILSFDQLDITDQAIARLDETLGAGGDGPDALAPDATPLSDAPRQP